MKAERLAAHTTFGVGGFCAAWGEASGAEEVAEVMEEMRRMHLSARPLGGGSNVLAADGGVEAGVIHVAPPPNGRDRIAESGGGTIVAAAGIALDEVARWSVEAGGGALAWASGIPGTVGGAVAGNAGAFGEQTGDWVESVEVVLPDRTTCWIPRGEMNFGYRTSRLSGGANGIITRVRFVDRAGESRDVLRMRRQEILALRKAKHPAIGPGLDGTAGSFFKNLPPQEEGGRRRAIGAELEKIGAKRERVGGAYVFGKHANILMAGPGATAWDVYRLGQRLERMLWEKCGIRAEREVQCWGFEDADATS